MTSDAFIFSLNMALIGLVLIVIIGAVLAVGIDEFWEDQE